jgi:N-acetylglutamate synthase/N-acetylornithine aminotransferase
VLVTAVVLVSHQLAATLVQEGAGARVTAVVLMICQDRCQVSKREQVLATAVVLVIRQLAAMLVQDGAGAGVTAVVLVICQLASCHVSTGGSRCWGDSCDTSEPSASCHLSTAVSRCWRQLWY